MNSYLERKLDTIHFLSEIFVYTLVKKWQLFGQKSALFSRIFLKFNKIKRIVHDLGSSYCMAKMETNQPISAFKK